MCLNYFYSAFSHGGWVIDGFPSNRSHWSAMIDAELLPDVVISLENSNKDKDLLMERFCKDNNLPDPSTWEQKEVYCKIFTL